MEVWTAALRMLKLYLSSRSDSMRHPSLPAPCMLTTRADGEAEGCGRRFWTKRMRT